MTNRNKKGQFVKGDNLQDLTGKRFGRLTAIRLSSRRSGRKTYWDCICDCGSLKTVRTDILKSGTTLSCGCLKKEQDKINLPNGQGRVKHGFSKTRIYNIWKNMHIRCEDPTNTSYADYGGRGIKVCSQWKSVKNFISWAYFHGYQNNLTIDRIDVNGDYKPSNCRWSTWDEQSKNKRNTILISYLGQTKPLTVWAEELNIDKGLIRNRYKLGIKPPRLFKKGRLMSPNSHLITYKGRTQNITSWANEIGIAPKTLTERVRRGIELPKLFYPGSLNGYKK